MNLNFIKNGFIASLLFAAQKTWAQTKQSQFPDPVALDYGVVRSPGAQVISSFNLLIFFIILFAFLSGIISPIIGYRWYIKHGGTKKWLKWFAYAPLIMSGVAVFYMLVLLLSR